jgi:gamma-glutamyl hercynylcysteine S-oxide synthase
MATEAIKSTSLPPDAELVLGRLDGAREQTLALVSHLDDEQLERVHSSIMSPLVWDLGHIAAYEDLWIVHRHGGLDLLHPELAALYDAFETPRAVRGEIEKLGPADARHYLENVRERTAHVLAAVAKGDEEWLTIPAGSFEMGAPAGRFAYDNERPRHPEHLGGFRIAHRPVTNASWMHFCEGGGYERREWWSREGWAWKEDYDITHHPAVATGDPEAPVCHVSWFEADAFARAHDARLPTEAEWEKAATWEQESDAGDTGGMTLRGSLLAGLGQVWEWTGTAFDGYPGFEAFPYREYSEVFFGGSYRVLRGGSWATSPRVAGPHFRNWDLPERRQIFAGLRLVQEAV